MSCDRASKFLDASKIAPAETVSASRKLGRKEAVELVKAAAKVIVVKGKKIDVFTPGGAAQPEVVAALLGSTGNLRAPCVRAGKTLLVGFGEAAWREALG